jgi:hypothetical protein
MRPAFLHIAMDAHAQWKYILFRTQRKKQLPLDIEHCSPMAIRSIILDVCTPTAILDQVALAYSDDEYVLRELVRCPNLSETTLAFIALTASNEIQSFISGARAMDLVVYDEKQQGLAAAGVQTAPPPGKRKLNIIQAVQRMTTPQKIKLALSGGKDARGLLIRESNKQVSVAVVENPRITDGEIEFFAQSTNLAEDVMRKIGMNSEWTKKYSIARALVNNPKCPAGISMQFVSRMHDKDLALLEKSRNVSEAVRSAARGLLMKKKLGKK